jgi:hypothetical protein
VCIRVIRGICVLSFFDGSVLLRLVIAWGLRRCRDFENTQGNIFIYIILLCMRDFRFWIMRRLLYLRDFYLYFSQFKLYLRKPVIKMRLEIIP